MGRHMGRGRKARWAREEGAGGWGVKLARDVHKATAALPLILAELGTDQARGPAMLHCPFS